MFKKAFKTKSNCQLKSSEKKKLLSRIKVGLPHLNDDHELFHSKDAMNVVKVATYSGVNVSVFVHGSTPIFFECQDTIYPTIFTLWKFPDLIISFSTYDAVVEKLYNGADLMLPGVILPPGVGLFSKLIREGSPVGVYTSTNLACVAVGKCVVSGSQIARGPRTGRAVEVLHTFGDELTKFLNDIPKLPMIDPAVLLASERVSPSDEPVPSLLNELQPEENGAGNDQTPLAEPSGDEPQNGDALVDNLADELEQSSLGPGMDEVAEYCLLKALTSNKIEFPLLTNLFYKNFMLSAVPDGLELNIKKTKHKKLSNMLKSMVNDGVLQIEDNKGVQTILSVNYSHAIFKDMRNKFEALELIGTKPSAPPMDEDPSSTLEVPLEIREDLVINKLVSPLFEKSRYQKGDSLSVERAREIIVAYVKATGLPQSSKNVTLDPYMSDVLCTRQLSLPWNEFMNKTLDKMGKCYVIRTSKDRVFSGKGKLPLIEISTATRSGNKSVTLVNNLDKYGISINEFARHCQHALAASTTTHSTSSGTQFQVQGNHKPYISAMLVEKYNIPKRLILGFAEKTKAKKGRK